MADIFISYSKLEPGPTELLAQALVERGYRVWWDTSILTGDNFREVILQQLASARAVIVIWTGHSVGSDWVISEADRARASKKLIPVRTSAVRVHDIPPPFDRLQTDDVTNLARIVLSLKALGVLPNPSKKLAREGETHVLEGRIQEGLTAFAAAISADLSDLTSYLARGRSLALMHRRMEEGLESELVAQAFSDLATVIDRDLGGSLAVQAYLARADLHSVDFDTLSALSDYTKAIELQPAKVDTYLARARAHEGTKHGDEHRSLRAAIEDYTRAIELTSPDQASSLYQIYIRRGDDYREMKEHALALADYNRAVGLAPNEASAYCQRGSLFRTMKDYQRALADHSKVVDLIPHATVRWIYRGELFVEMGQPDRALDDYNKAISLEVETEGSWAWQAYMNRGQIFQERGDLDRAIADYTKGLSLNDLNAHDFALRAQAYRLRGDFDRALADLSKAILLRPQARYYVSRGRVFEQKGDRKHAVDDYQAALKIAPSNKHAQERIAALA